MLALTGGEDFSHDDGWCNAPPILFSLSCQRKENAPCTVEEKRERFWRLRRPHTSIEGRSVNLLCGRRDFFLFPRFAHGGVRAVGVCVYRFRQTSSSRGRS